MKSLFRILALTMFVSGLAVFAQTTPAPTPAPKTVVPAKPYDSTKAQLEYFKEKDLQSQFAQIQQMVKDKTTQLQNEYKAHEDWLASWIASVKAANKWGDDVTYDRDTDTWTQVEKPKTPETKPAEPAKK